MSKLREAAKRVAEIINRPGYYATDLVEPRKELNAALSEPDLEGAVVEAAKAWHFTRTSANVCRVMCTVDALLASQRPRYEVWPEKVTANKWHAGPVGGQTVAAFTGPDAERHAKDWAAARNKEAGR